MVYEVLARKWRPQVFQDVIGQEHITQTLMNAIKTDRLAHAYLFSGARGVGKTSVARVLAKAINCTEGQDNNPCNKCSSCIEITNGSSMDVQEIDGASNRGIDEIRELRDNIKYMPSSSRFRVYIIDEVHMLTIQAFNALLKTLEEPPPHVKFFFATTEPQKISDLEGIKISKSGLTIIAREAEGSMRDAESLLDQVASYTGSKIDDKNITDILGIIDRDIIFDTSRAIIEGSAEKCIEIIENIYNYGYDIKEFYRAIMDQFRNLIVCLIAPQSNLLDMTDDDRAEVKRLAETAGLEKLQQSLNILIAREEGLRFTSHTRLVLETIMIKLCRLGDLLSVGELIEKIEGLEKKILTSSSAPYADIPASNVSEQEPVWENEAKDDAETQEAVHDDPDWDDLMKYLASKNRAMSNVLKEWTLKSFSGDTLEISRGSSSFSSSYLDDPERFDKLIGYCRDLFKRDIAIKIVGDRIKTNGIIRSGQGKKDTESDKNTDLPRPVQEVLKVFQGEIKQEVPVDGKKAEKLEKQRK